MNTEKSAPDRSLLPEPKLGEWLRGIYASETNPHRDGMYVRTIHRNGMNAGKGYQCTDGKGNFWEYPAQSVERIPDTRALAREADKPCEIHSCSYYCDRPACIKAQRDELRDRVLDAK